MSSPAPVESWRRVRLTDVCSLRAEGVHPSENPDAVYVGLEHMDTGHPRLTRFGLASEVNSSKSKFCVGDVLYGKLRPYLDKAVLAEQDGICSTDILVFKNTQDTLAEFLIHRVHSSAFLDHANRTTRGVNHPRTSWASLKEFEFYLPSLPEQQAIARALRAIQEAKEARQRELSLECERKAALMQYLFTNGARGKARKKTEIGEMPESWQVVEVNEACSIIVDCPHSTPKFLDEGILVARNFNIRSGRFVTPPNFYTSEEEYWQRVKRCVPQPGDVLFSREAPVGEACLIPPNTRISLGQRTMLLRTDKSKLDGYFLVQAFYAENIRLRMLALASGVTAPHLNVAEVKRLNIPLPSLDEQKEIADTIYSCDTKIEALEKELVLLEELFKAILEELMTGRLSAVPLIKSENLQLEASSSHT